MLKKVEKNVVTGHDAALRGHPRSQFSWNVTTDAKSEKFWWMTNKRSSEILRDEWKIFSIGIQDPLGTGHPTASARHCIMLLASSDVSFEFWLDPFKERVTLLNNFAFVMMAEIQKTLCGHKCTWSSRALRRCFQKPECDVRRECLIKNFLMIRVVFMSKKYSNRCSFLFSFTRPYLLVFSDFSNSYSGSLRCLVSAQR